MIRLLIKSEALPVPAVLLLPDDRPVCGALFADFFEDFTATVHSSRSFAGSMILDVPAS
jgi:hypothetical protein